MESIGVNIRVGPKRKHVRLPDGWHRVLVGSCIKGDQFLNLGTYKFQPVEHDDIGISCDDFEVLIRKDVK